MKSLSFNNTIRPFPSTNWGSRIKRKEYHILVSQLLSLQLPRQRLLRWNESRVSISNKTLQLTDRVAQTGTSPTGFAGSTYQNTDVRLCHPQQLTCRALWLLGTEAIKRRTTHFRCAIQAFVWGNLAQTKHKWNLCH